MNARRCNDIATFGADVQARAKLASGRSDAHILRECEKDMTATTTRDGFYGIRQRPVFTDEFDQSVVPAVASVLIKNKKPTGMPSGDSNVGLWPLLPPGGYLVGVFGGVFESIFSKRGFILPLDGEHGPTASGVGKGSFQQGISMCYH